ncbi:MAG: DMT family transporter [Oscillospiraceae bacterium]|nr:DMT family transporter [Oscillospiraceae bacterium]
MFKRIRGMILLLLTALIWGTAFVAQSESMRYVQPFTYNCLRALLGGAVLIPVIFLFRGMKRGTDAKPADRRMTVIGGLCCGVMLCIASAFQQAGVAKTTAGKAGFITALYVILVPLIGLFTRKKPPAVIWLCAAAAIAGFGLLCISEDFSLGLGDLLVLCCTLFFALHIITVDFFCERAVDPTAMSCIQFFTAAALHAVGMQLFEEPHFADICAARNQILYAGILSSGVAYTLQIFGQRETPPTLATLVLSLESVFAALSGWLILHERLSLRELLGCALVLAAVIAAQLLTAGKQEQNAGGHENPQPPAG